MVEYYAKPSTTEVDIPKSIYFGGCCFGAAFYVGVYKAMVERWGADFIKNTHFSGGSVGTVFATGLALGKSAEYMDNFYRRAAEETVKRMNPFNSIYTGALVLEPLLQDMLSDPECHIKIQGRCCFSTSVFFDKHQWHTEWDSHEELYCYLKASLHIPIACPRSPLLRGVEIVDGAYSFAGVDLPDGDATLYVGIDPHAEITRVFTNAEMLYPAVGAEYDRMVQSGYDAFMKWDGTMIKKVGHRRPNWEALIVLWCLKFLEVPLYLLVDFVYGVLHVIVTILKVLGILRVKKIYYMD